MYLLRPFWGSKRKGGVLLVENNNLVAISSGLGAYQWRGTGWKRRGTH